MAMPGAAGGPSAQHEPMVSPPAKAVSASWLQNGLFGVLLVLVTLLAYQPVWFGQPIWDDDMHLTPPGLRSWAGLASIWFKLGATQQYYPLTFSAFWLQHQLWGDATLGYHLVNIGLHCFAALLFWRILRRLEVPGAYLAAAIFALHPIHVESVAWMTELKNTLSGVLALGTVLTYLGFDQTRRKAPYFLALGWFALGLMAKTAIAPLPAALLVIFWWQRGTLIWKRDVLPLLPYFLVGLAASLITVVAEQTVYGAQGMGFQLSMLERCLLAGRAIWFHLGKLIWPVNLAFMYAHWHISQAVWWQYLYPAAAVLLLGGVWSLRARNRSLPAALLLFAGMLFPALGFFNAYSFRYSFVNDHHQYLASLGLIALGSAAVARLWRRWGILGKATGNLLCLGLLVGLAALTWRHARVFRNEEALWRDMLAKDPNSWLAHNNWGTVLVAEGKLDAAMEQFQAAIRSEPAYPEGYSNLGEMLGRKGRIDEAIPYYRKALQLKPLDPKTHFMMASFLDAQGAAEEALSHYLAAVQMKPDFMEAYGNLSNLCQRRGDAQRALAYATEAVRLQPDNAKAHFNLGGALSLLGRTPEAISEYTTAVRLQPDYAEAHRNLAWNICLEGKLEEGIQEYQAALKLNPRGLETRGMMAAALVELGRTNEAVNVFEEALQLEPTSAEAHFKYASLLMALGQTAAAASQFQSALRYGSGQPETHRRYGVLLAGGGKWPEAIEQFREALRLQPDAETHCSLAAALLQQGQGEQAVAEYRESLRLKPDSPAALNDLAWLLAANASPSVRNGPEAVTLAERACQLTDNKNPVLIGTLAAAYAEAGRFEQAVATGEKAKALATAAGQKELAERNSQLLELYRARKPFHEAKD